MFSDFTLQRECSYKTVLVWSLCFDTPENVLHGSKLPKGCSNDVKDFSKNIDFLPKVSKING